MKSKDELNAITREILDASISVHREMGPGLLESVYQHCLTTEFSIRGIGHAAFVHLPLTYKGRSLNKDYIIDILVEDEVVVELKSVEVVLPIHEAQLISYMKLARKRLGLLINFNVVLLKHGFKRYINNLDNSAPLV